MANKEIHELITAEELSSSDVITEQRENSGTWLTRKLTFNALGLFLNKVLNYASDLHTTSKTIIGAINELAAGSGQSLDTLNDVDIDAQTLADGQGIFYDATEQKWKNGTVGGGHAYSTTEQVVGTWIDGKTLYEKTVSETITNSSAQVIATVVGAEYKRIEGFVSSSSGVVPVPYNDGTSFYVPYTDSDDVILAKSNAGQGVGNTLILTIQYTKSST